MRGNGDLGFFSSSFSLEQEAESKSKDFKMERHTFLDCKRKGLRGVTAAVDTAPLSWKHFKRLRERHVGTSKRLPNQMSQDLHGNREAIQPMAMLVK